MRYHGIPRKNLARPPGQHPLLGSPYSDNVASEPLSREEAPLSEEKMVELIQGALAARGIEDEALAVGQFNPRGHTGAMFAGGLVAGEAGSLLVDAGESAAVGAGSLAGMYAADARSGLPAKMLVAGTATAVYGFAAPTRHDEPTALVFQVPRAGLTISVHQRVNVRVLELIDKTTAARIESSRATGCQ